MTVTSNAEFAKRMMLLAKPAEEFRPTATYDPDGDCVEFLARPDPFYAERVDDLLTVYYSQDTGEVIGSLLKGVAGFCQAMLEKMPGFKIEIHDGRVKLVHIFLARLWSSERDPQGLATLTYRKLIEVADKTDVEAEVCPVPPNRPTRSTGTHSTTKHRRQSSRTRPKRQPRTPAGGRS